MSLHSENVIKDDDDDDEDDVINSSVEEVVSKEVDAAAVDIVKNVYELNVIFEYFCIGSELHKNSELFENYDFIIINSNPFLRE